MTSVRSSTWMSLGPVLVRVTVYDTVPAPFRMLGVTVFATVVKFCGGGLIGVSVPKLVELVCLIWAPLAM